MSSPISRREFLEQSGSCAAHLALAAAVMPLSAQLAWSQSSPGSVVAREPFGALEKISDGVWALISTPLNGDRTTVSNGGIIAGRNGVLAIEGFNDPKGAQWMATKAKELTGKWPTHVVITHYHADHSNGIAGYQSDGEHPVTRATERTRELVVTKNLPADAARVATLNGAQLLSMAESTTLDLGGRSVRIIPRGGHTDSDVTLELDDSLFFFPSCFERVFSHFGAPRGSRLERRVHALRRSPAILVPAHRVKPPGVFIRRNRSGGGRGAGRGGEIRGGGGNPPRCQLCSPRSAGGAGLAGGAVGGLFPRGFGGGLRGFEVSPIAAVAVGLAVYAI